MAHSYLLCRIKSVFFFFRVGNNTLDFFLVNSVALYTGDQHAVLYLLDVLKWCKKRQRHMNKISMLHSEFLLL